jgi:hypothetical protein
MTIGRMTIIVMSFAVAGAVLGGALGWGMGTYLPDLYRIWFPPDPHVEGPPPSTVQIGVGLGLLQGFGLGFLLGCILILASAIRSGKAKPDPPSP